MVPLAPPTRTQAHVGFNADRAVPRVVDHLHPEVDEEIPLHLGWRVVQERFGGQRLQLLSQFGGIHLHSGAGEPSKVVLDRIALKGPRAI